MRRLYQTLGIYSQTMNEFINRVEEDSLISITFGIENIGELGSFNNTLKVKERLFNSFSREYDSTQSSRKINLDGWIMSEDLREKISTQSFPCSLCFDFEEMYKQLVSKGNDFQLKNK